MVGLVQRRCCGLEVLPLNPSRCSGCGVNLQSAFQGTLTSDLQRVVLRQLGQRIDQQLGALFW